MSDQFVCAINDTDTHLAETGSAGILGLGFPLSSSILAAYFLTKFPDPSAKRSLGNAAANLNAVARSRPASVNDLLDLVPIAAPIVPRAVVAGTLSQPMFSVTLQRDTIDPGGNVGMLTLGGLPDTVDPAGILWSDVRLYDSANLPTAFNGTHYPQ